MFDRYVSNVVNKIFLYDFSSILIVFGVVRSVFYVYIFDFITHSYNTFINIKILLIHYLCREMGTNVFFFLDILSNNSKY